MNERIRISVKTPESKEGKKVSKMKKTDLSQSTDSPVDRILFLQRTIGNQAIQRLIKSGTIQAKLRIGQPGDVYEQEADRVAEQVMRMPDIQPQSVQRKCPKCEEELQKAQGEQIIQTKEATNKASELTPDQETNINTFRSGGQPLPQLVRAFFEPRFGHDFSQVQVHTDARAAESARALNALAYTVGGNIVFGAGQYSPGTSEGKKLLAHELTHSIQQGAALELVPHKLGIMSPADSSEREVETTSRAIMQGVSFNQHSVKPVQIACHPAAPMLAPLSVDRIDIIDGSAGAIGGFPAILGNADLNTPGPFNYASTGEVKNVHQIHFHLDSGNSAGLTPMRVVQGSNWKAGVESKHPPDQVLPPGTFGPPAPGGFGGVRTAPDGPPVHEIQRPSTDKIVVADAPGTRSLSSAQYPYIHKSTFTLTVAGGGADIARIKYGVRIQKNNATDIPNTENRIFAIEKEDLVRGKSLP